MPAESCTRRALLVAAPLLWLPPACAWATAAGGRLFVDDAGRRVVLPARITRVFAAGAPAEVLLYTLVPEMLVGRNHMPSEAAQEFMPAAFRHPQPIVWLPDPDGAEHDAELLALRPDVYIDYGDLDADYVQSVSNVQARTGIPGIILDGRYEQIPRVYRKLGAALGVAPRGRQLARATERLLQRYPPGAADSARGALPTVPFSWGPRPPSVNRLPGLIWQSYIAGNRPFDAAFYTELREFFALFYHYRPSEVQLRQRVESTLAESR